MVLAIDPVQDVAERAYLPETNTLEVGGPEWWAYLRYERAPWDLRRARSCSSHWLNDAESYRAIQISPGMAMFLGR